MKSTPVIALVLALLLMSVSAAFAGATVSGIHRLVSAESAPEGSSLAFRLKVTNTGDAPFVSARLVARDPLVVHGSPGSEIAIPGLAAGESVTIDVNILSGLPSDQLREGLEIPLNFDVEIADAAGNATVATLVCEGGTP